MSAHSATFGAGCFWGVEKSFRKKFGVALSNIQVGYAGGTAVGPSYKQVCTGQTGHAEVIHFQYDPAQVNFKTLVDFFFRMHDPTTMNRQGGDVGTQYRSAILYHDESQKVEAEEVIAYVKKAYGGAISTTLEKFEAFYPAEDYHQDYLDKNPHGYECPTHFERSWEKIATKFNGVAPSL